MFAKKGEVFAKQMRKIISKEKAEKKRRRNQLLVGTILILVMVFSLLGYSLNSNGQSGTVTVDYNGFRFTQDSSTNLWDMNKGNLNFSFEYNPYEIYKTNSTLNSIDSYSGKPLYISSDSSDAETEIYRNLFYLNPIAERVQDACVAGEPCSGNFPVKTCSDNFIIIRENSSTGITQQNNCVFINGPAENLSRMSDSFLLKIIGIQ